MFARFCVVRRYVIFALPFERWQVRRKALASTLFVSIAFRGYVTIAPTGNIPTVYFDK